MAVDTKQRILAAATELFASHGYHGTTLAIVADRVGLRPPALYRHFKNKQALYQAVVDSLFEPFMQMAEPLGDVDSGAVSVEDFLAPIIGRYVEHPVISRIILQATLAGGEQLDYLADTWFTPFFDRVKSLAPDGAPYANDHRVIANLHALMLGYQGLAPLHRKIFGFDPLNEDSLAEHFVLLKQFGSLVK